MLPVLFQIGGLNIYSYGFMLALGFIVSGYLLRKELKRIGFPVDLADAIVISALLGGVFGAKFYSVIEGIVKGEGIIYSVKSFFSGAGLVWYGGLIGGAIAGILVIRHKKVSIMRALDILAPLLILGYAFGRMGCFLSGDGDYGPPSDLPWAMSFPNGTVPTNERVHPTPVYEIILCLIIFAYLWRIRKKIRPAGWMFGVYLILAAAERFITEFWRVTAKVLFNTITMAQIISVIMVIIGVWLMLRTRNMPIPVDTPVVELKKELDKQKTKPKQAKHHKKIR
jgi:phosphatidylglycerol:prolipoprotein diacylglycerol transferase